MSKALLPQGLKRILVVCPNWLGDVLFATPFLRALKKAYPETELDVLLPQRVQEALAHNTMIHQAISYNERLNARSLFASFSLSAKLRSRSYDAGILLSPSNTKSRLLRSAGIGIRAGFTRAGKDQVITHGVPEPATALHKIDHFLSLAAGLGVPACGREMDFFADEGSANSLKNKLHSAGVKAGEPYVVIHIGGNWPLKRWPLLYFAAWVKLWLEAQKGYIVICGTSSEEELSMRLSGDVSDKRLVSLCGQTTLAELSWLLKGARLVVSNDSGPAHLAASQKAPMIGLFGPTSADLTGPVSAGPLHILQARVGCAVPCYYKTCSDHLCMRSITPLAVFQKAQEMIR